MKKFRILIMGGLLSLIVLKTQAQTTLNSGGASASTKSMTHDYSIGEMCLVHTSSSPNVIITQGILQPYEIKKLVQSVAPVIKMNVYPNPSNNIVYLDFIASNNSTLQLELLDINGKVTYQTQLQNVIGNQKIPIDIQNYIAGNYLLKVKIGNEEHNEQFNFKIQKIN